MAASIDEAREICTGVIPNRADEDEAVREPSEFSPLTDEVTVDQEFELLFVLLATLATVRIDVFNCSQDDGFQFNERFIAEVPTGLVTFQYWQEERL